MKNKYYGVRISIKNRTLERKKHEAQHLPSTQTINKKTQMRWSLYKSEINNLIERLQDEGFKLVDNEFEIKEELEKIQNESRIRNMKTSI